MSESGHVAECFECGWSSPICSTENHAHHQAGWHAMEYGCPINRVRVMFSSEVSDR